MQRTNLLLLLLVFVALLYVGVYLAVVQPRSSGILRIGPGPWHKVAVYPLGRVTNPIRTNAIPTYSLDPITTPLFFPLNRIDRTVRRNLWSE